MKITELEITHIDGRVLDYVVIEHADSSTTTMLKSTYEAQQAEQSTPIVTADE
jgi:hypothetical protein